MKVPFTIEQFFNVFESYNTAIWPAQIVAYILGIIAVLAVIRGGKNQSRIVSAVLVSFWIWISVVYHIMHFAAINPIAKLFGIFFIFQGILLFAAGCIANRLRFRFSFKLIPAIGVLLIIYSMVIYPMLGVAFGHSYPRAPMFGVAPCPTTIFTFGILLLATEPVPVSLVIIPLLWALVGTTAATKLQVPQDYGLGVAGILGIFLISINNRFQRQKEVPNLKNAKG